MDIRKQVGKNLAKFRKMKGLSQEELAFETDLHRTYVSGIERGIRNPTVLILHKLSIALKIPLTKLVELP